MSQAKLISSKIKKAFNPKMCVLSRSFLTLSYVTISDAFTRYVQGCQSPALIVPFYNYNPITLSNCTKIMSVNDKRLAVPFPRHCQCYFFEKVFLVKRN